MFRNDRLRELLADQEMSQSELARRVGVSQTAIYKLVSGAGQGSKFIHRLAEELGVLPGYLMGETDVPAQPGDYERHLEKRRKEPDYPKQKAVSDRRLGWASQPVENADTIELEEFDVSFGLGAAYIHDSPVEARKRVFSRSWIRQFTQSPFDHLFWGTGIGDSMTPTILDADVVLIDTFDRTPRFADKLWAVEVGGLGSIKRLRPTTDGEGMRLLSSAPDVPEEIVFDGEMTIVGRVVAVVRKV